MKGGSPLAKYITTQGDTFDLIAHRLWGDEKKMHLLMAANPQVQDFVFFSAGIVLDVPDLPQPRVKEGIPPWQK